MLPFIMAGIAAVGQVASAVYSHGAQQEAYETNRRAAGKAAQISLAQLQLQKQQEAAVLSRSLFDIERETRRASAVTAVSAGEQGLAGASVDMVLNDIERQGLIAGLDQQRNFQKSMQQKKMEERGILANMQNQINSVQQPSSFATGLGMMGGVAQIGGGLASKMPGSKDDSEPEKEKSPADKARDAEYRKYGWRG